jgi:hypothetical protein
MTPVNGKISGEAGAMKRRGELFGTWTRLGKVFIKRSQNSPPYGYSRRKISDVLLH